MDQLIEAFKQAVDQEVSEIKNSSKTYGEAVYKAIKLSREALFVNNFENKVKSFVFDESARKIRKEQNMTAIQVQ